jgi:ABC-type multidrug transport system permease subunit
MKVRMSFAKAGRRVTPSELRAFIGFTFHMKRTLVRQLQIELPFNITISMNVYEIILCSVIKVTN